MKFGYRFPANKRAKENTLNDQVAKVREEGVEVYRACMDWDEDAMLEEVMDVIYAAEGILRKYDKKKVEEAYEKVVQKARDRGDIS